MNLKLQMVKTLFSDTLFWHYPMEPILCVLYLFRSSKTGRWLSLYNWYIILFFRNVNASPLGSILAFLFWCVMYRVIPCFLKYWILFSIMIFIIFVKCITKSFCKFVLDVVGIIFSDIWKGYFIYILLGRRQNLSNLFWAWSLKKLLKLFSWLLARTELTLSWILFDVTQTPGIRHLRWYC
jgi:hypothetical protein